MRELRGEEIFGELEVSTERKPEVQKRELDEEIFLAKLLVTGEEKHSSLLAHFSWRGSLSGTFSGPYTCCSRFP